MTATDAAEEESPSDPVLAIFLLVLPDPLPIEHGSTWTRQLDEREPLLDGQEMRPLDHLPPAEWARGDEGYNFVSLRFWQVRDDQADVPEFDHRSRLAGRVAQALNPDAVPNPDELVEHYSTEPSEAYRTVVEAVTFVARPDDLVATEDKPDPLTRCIDVLTQYHRAYRLAARAHVPELTYERLHPAVLWFRKPAFDPEALPEPAGLMLLANRNIPVEQLTPLERDDLNNLAQSNVRAAAGDPFIVYAERRLEAEIEVLTNGRARESVVQSGIAAEVLLGALLGLTMWEEHERGELTTEAAAEVFGLPLATRIKTQYSQRLGGKWFADTDPIRGWQTDIANVRHRVVHAGYEPDTGQAYAARDALQALERFIGDRLAVKWKTYPRTAWLFLGTTGFREHGRNKLRQAEAWADAEGGLAAAKWIRAYQEWREQVNTLVVHGR